LDQGCGDLFKHLNQKSDFLLRKILAFQKLVGVSQPKIMLKRQTEKIDTVNVTLVLGAFMRQ
jgi:hypothetical protein